MNRNEVRWKQGGRWRYGHAAADFLTHDGSVLAYDGFNGSARSLRPETIERLTRGPRGGVRWTPWTTEGGHQ